MAYKAIIFDAEGVIIDTEHSVWTPADSEFFRNHSIPYEEERVKHALAGRSLQDGVRVLKQMFPLKGDDEDLAEERLRLVRKHFKEDIKFVPGFEKFYAKASGDYKTAVATSLRAEFLGLVEKRLGLKGMFNGHVYTIEMVGNKSKPDPAVFLYAAKMLGVRPEECIVIEDAANGIEAAKKAGMYAIGITTSFRRDKLSSADQVVEGFGEIVLPEA